MAMQVTGNGATDDSSRQAREEARQLRRQFLVGLGRAFGGALIFALPMLMTMEMWWLGFYTDRLRLALLLVLAFPLLVLLSYHAGFERTLQWRDDLRDAAIAYAIGILASAVVLTVFGIVRVGTPPVEIIGKIAVQSVPAGIGAMLGRSLLGKESARPAENGGRPSYASELFLMGAGALFLGLNVAPTEEMVLISYKMTEWHALALIGLSLLLMHAFVYSVEFKGTHAIPETPWWSGFLRFTIAGYAIAALVSLYILWTFGRTDGLAATHAIMAVVVLGFPASVGAAAARLIL